MINKTLVWEKGIPKEPGYYWIRGETYNNRLRYLKKPIIARVYYHSDIPYFHVCWDIQTYEFLYPLEFVGPLEYPDIIDS